jgi:diguanylate cyclase (GGDEF)-like protein
VVVHQHRAASHDEAHRGRGEIVRVGEYGPAHWLAFDSFRAFAEAGTLDTDGGAARIEANEALARALGDERTGWRCRDILVSALKAAGRLDESVAVAEQLMDHYDAQGDTPARLQILGQVIVSRFARGEFERALDELTDGLAGLSQLRESNRASAAAFVTVANAASAAEMFELASAQLRRGTALVRATGDGFLNLMVDAITARNEARWANRLEMIGRRDEAAARYREAMRAALRAQRDSAASHWVRVGRLYEGFAWTCLGEAELGRVTLLDALDRYDAPMEAEDALVLRLGLARACTELGDTLEARRQLHLTAGLQDETISRQWQVATVLQAADIERAETAEDHPAIVLAKHAAMLLATSLWEERERRLESVMVRMQMLDLAQENERVGQAATEDPLTGLGNRRKLDAALRELTTQPTSPTCLLFIDLDCFKYVNDTFSHAIGDEVLRAVAVILQRESRERDVVARYGGDEFVVMLRGAALRTGAHVAERIRKAVAAHQWGRIAPGLQVRVSVGVAEHRVGMSYEQLMAAADAAVYDAKEAGRDRVAVA